jgi:hypothetical protein
MMRHDDDNPASEHPTAFEAEASDDSTGLPWPRTWPALYLFVVASLVLWVALLVALERSFS